MINSLVVFFKRPEQEVLEWNIDDIIRNNFILVHYTKKMKEKIEEKNG